VANARVPPFHWAYHEGDRRLPPLRSRPGARRSWTRRGGWIGMGTGSGRTPTGCPRDLHQVQPGEPAAAGHRRDHAGAAPGDRGGHPPQVVEWATMLEPDPNSASGTSTGWSWGGSPSSRWTTTTSSTPGGHAYGWSGTRNPGWTGLLDTLQLIVDREEALPLWHGVPVRAGGRAALHLPLLPPPAGRGEPRLRGWTLDARGEWVNIGRWWIPGEADGGREPGDHRWDPPLPGRNDPTSSAGSWAPSPSCWGSPRSSSSC
jgi:hypothetical protein